MDQLHDQRLALVGVGVNRISMDGSTRCRMMRRSPGGGGMRVLLREVA
jgi:hypothetical protein